MIAPFLLPVGFARRALADALRSRDYVTLSAARAVGRVTLAVALGDDQTGVSPSTWILNPDRVSGK